MLRLDASPGPHAWRTMPIALSIQFTRDSVHPTDDPGAPHPQKLTLARRQTDLGGFADELATRHLDDVWVLVGAGVLGYAMRGLGYDPAPLVLGLVLGPVLERSLLQALTIGRGELRELWSSAPAAIMLAATVVVLLAPAARAGLRPWTRGRTS